MTRFSFSPSVLWFAAIVALGAFIGMGVYGLRHVEYSKAYLGAQFMPLTNAAQARTPFLRGGALVINIVQDGPVSKAGIKPNTLVAAINGASVSDARAAAHIIAGMAPGARATFTTYNVADGDPKPHKVTVTLTDAPPPTAPLTVRPFRPLAKPWFPPPNMVANAAWSRKISGAVQPSPLVLLQREACTALAPAGWKIANASNGFWVSSAGGNVKAGYVRLEALSDGALRSLLTDVFGQAPKLNLPRPLKNDFSRVDFGTNNGYGGYVLYRAKEKSASVWVIAMPGADTATLLPLATSVALSIRCGAPAIEAVLVDAARNATAVSEKCLAGDCDEGDLAGLYNSELRMGYVHSAKGENFLIDPRASWQTGPEGAGYYRQTGGEVEKMAPGRTN